MPDALSIDFETRSLVDLRRTSVYPYAAHPTTDIWCMAYAIGDEDPGLWTPGTDIPPEVREHVRTGRPLRAWNAQFERIIWWAIMHHRYGFPNPTREQWYDTAADAAALALPRSLNRAALVLGLDEEKDDEGHRLMLRMARPRAVDGDGITWWDGPEYVARLCDYCLQDVRVERAVSRRIRPLGAQERAVYLLDQLVNDRGVALDLPLIRAAERIVEEGVSRANEELRELTGGTVDRVTQVQRLLEWVTTHTEVEVPNLQKATIRDLLEGEEQLPLMVRRALEIRQATAKSSTAKLTSMQEYACGDGRARGMVLYHGASTGRWAGKGPQPQNYPRPTVGGVEEYIPEVMRGDYQALEEAEGSPVAVVSSMLRSMLVAAPGLVFRSADFSQIEARVLAWVAEQEDLVRLFREGGKVYEEMAAYIYDLDVGEVSKDSVERQIGKNSVLGAGFQMGPDRFAEQVQEQAGIVLDRGERDEGGTWVRPDMARKAIHGYRTRFPRIPEFWRAIDAAAQAAVRRPGEVTTCGRGGAVRFVVRGQFLWCILPSGRPLAYALPELRQHTVHPGEGDDWEAFRTTSVTYMGVDSRTRKWTRRFAYGGLWTENIVQATARDVLAEAMLRVEGAGYPVVLTVHDEVLCEVDPSHGTQEEFMELMRVCPSWARGLPVEAEGWTGERYRK